MVFGTGHTPQGRRPIAFKIDGPLTTWYTDNLFLRDQATYFRVNGQLTLMGPSYLLYEAGLLTSTREGSNSSIEEKVIKEKNRCPAIIYEDKDHGESTR